MSSETTEEIPGTAVDVRTGEMIPLSTYAGTSQVKYADLFDSAAVVEGYSLTDKHSLIGVPFIITGITIRYGGLLKGVGPRDYVSVEAVTKDDAPIVFNDGSTGVRRQLVQYLESQGLLTVGPDGPDHVICGVEGMVESFKLPELRPLAAPRGLRVSEYENEFTAEGETFYLA